MVKPVSSKATQTDELPKEHFLEKWGLPIFMIASCALFFSGLVASVATHHGSVF